MEAWRRRIPNLLVHEVDEEFVVLDAETDLIHRLNPTASAIWRSLEEAGTAEEIARRLVDEFDVEWEVALDDVRAMLDEMAALSLIVPHPA
jgi:hypothetical protein